MIDVREVQLNIHIPSDELCIVAQQPFVRFTEPRQEPFRWADKAIDEQLAAIGRTLDLASEGLSGRPPTFVVFPEYAVPGIRGVQAIDDRVKEAAWPNNSVVMAGIDGLDRNKYEELCSALAAEVTDSNSPARVPNDKWVNCCVLWAKECDSTVRSWLQPKFRPSWPEAAVTCSDMFRGSSIFVFEAKYEPTGHPCRFATFICYDWVVEVAGQPIRDKFIATLEELWKKSNTALDWVFVIQRNLQPNDRSFLTGTFEFLTDRGHAFVDRSEAVVMHMNTAASKLPARSGAGGFSSCVFSPRAQVTCCGPRPTVYMPPNLLGRAPFLGRCKDVVFREAGECIHAFAVRVPRFLQGQATDRSFPVTEACVCAVGDTADPRLCGGPIPASVKWINDFLDETDLLSKTLLRDSPVRGDAEATEAEVVRDLRHLVEHKAKTTVAWAASWFSTGGEATDDKLRGNPDLWEKREQTALEHVLHSLTCLGVAYKLEVSGAACHGTMDADGIFIHIVAICGKSYEDCCRHFDEHVPRTVGPDPILLVARDRLGLTMRKKEIERFSEGEGAGVCVLDYTTLATWCRDAADTSELKDQLDAFLPRDRRII